MHRSTFENLGGKLYVTYACKDSAKHDDVAGPGHGYVSEFDTQGDFLGRIASNGTLNSPWGLAIAPSTFGPLAGDLLVGNFGDGTINAYNLGTDAFVGQLQGSSGPLSIDGLWGLTVGNDGSAGSSGKLYFSAGPERRVKRFVRRHHARSRALHNCPPRRWPCRVVWRRTVETQSRRCKAATAEQPRL